jgi:hypothetical protein
MFSMILKESNMKIHPLLIAAALTTGGLAFAQTPPATPAVTPAPAPAAAAPATQHKAAAHKMRMHGHAHKAAAAAAPTGAEPTTTREERMAAAEADYKASLEKGDQAAPVHKMHRHHGGHPMHKHQPAKAAPAS